MLNINTKITMGCFFAISLAVCDECREWPASGHAYQAFAQAGANRIATQDVSQLLRGSDLFELPNALNFEGFNLSSFQPAILAGGAPPPWPAISLDHNPVPYNFGSLFPREASLTQGALWEYIEYYYNRNLYISSILNSRLNLLLRQFFLGDYLNPSAQDDATSQEALTRQRENIRTAYIMATGAGSGGLVAQLLPPPDPDSLNEAFEESASQLNDLLDVCLNSSRLSNNTKFRLQNAKRTISLIQGDESTEHHPISSTEQYQTYSYDGLPNIKQLFVLAHRLGKVDGATFVESVMGELLNTPQKWRKWAKPFENTRFDSIIGHADVGQAIGADRRQGSPLVKSIVAVLEGGDTLPVAGCEKSVIPLCVAYTKAQFEGLTPLIEALFMVMRGHNDELFNPEPNHPACAEGAFLGLLRAASEKTSDDSLFLSHLNLELQQC